MTEEEYFRKNYPDSCYGDRLLSPHFDFFEAGVEFGERESEEKIAGLQHKVDVLQGYLDHDIEYDMDKKIQELELQLEREKNLNQCLSDNNEQLREQIERMKCCANCEYTPPFDKHCNKCIQGIIKLRYRNWKLREIKE